MAVVMTEGQKLYAAITKRVSESLPNKKAANLKTIARLQTAASAALADGEQEAHDQLLAEIATRKDENKRITDVTTPQLQEVLNVLSSFAPQG